MSMDPSRTAQQQPPIGEKNAGVHTSTSGRAPLLYCASTMWAPFRIKSSTLSILQPFHGLPNQSSYDHLMEFEQAWITVKLNGLPEDGLKLHLFPFTLKDSARWWLSMLTPRSFHSKILVQEVILSKYFPPSKAFKVRDHLVGFHQQDQESFHQTYDHFKDLHMSCPHHSLEKSLLLDLFYRGLQSDQRQRVDIFSGGTILETATLSGLSCLVHASWIS